MISPTSSTTRKRRETSNNGESNNSTTATYKSIIEVESPQIPQYFNSGTFSRRIHAKRSVIIAGGGGGGGGDHDDMKLWAQRMQKVSKRAAIASKKKIWDSNDAPYDAAQSAVDKWESSYKTLRSFLIHTSKSAVGVYNATKAASQKIEHSLLVPIRDMVILPAFTNAERAADQTIGFLQSEEAVGVANTTLSLVKQTPFVGEALLAPALTSSVEFLKVTWQIAQYPIPSPQAVRSSVDTIMSGTKWLISTSIHEIYSYANLVDATVTRTLSHTQWKVLGSGPYSTLNPQHKEEVINHLCQRYYSTKTDIGRYELAAHIQHQNRTLYHDLVLSGLLLDRGGEMTLEDTWLYANPDYRKMEKDPMLTNPSYRRQTASSSNNTDISPLWFYLPIDNDGKGKDSRWICFHSAEREKLESFFLSQINQNQRLSDNNNNNNNTSNEPRLVEEKKDDTMEEIQGVLAATDSENSRENSIEVLEEVEYSSDETHTKEESSMKYPTHAQWYEPQLLDDEYVLIDQRRHAVSFQPQCVKCHEGYTKRTEIPYSPNFTSHQYENNNNNSCEKCQMNTEHQHFDNEMNSLMLPITMKMRPTMWRFHGPGNEVRRAVWLIDTKRYGLQPYCEESAAVLEDAYLFLKWKILKNNEQNNGGGDNVLLTVQVVGPENEVQLVQFRSLDRITAIQKTLRGGFTLFKRRIYRGAHVQNHQKDVTPTDDDGNHDVFKMNRKEEKVNFSQMEGTNETDIVTVTENNNSNSLYSMLPAPQSLHKSSWDDSPRRNEAEDEPADHLVLVVHGIGEMLRTADLFGLALPALTSTIIDCCDDLRKNHDKVLDVHASQSNNSNKPNGHSATGRVEYLPVEWHEAFAIKSRKWNSSDGEKGGMASSTATIEDISLQTIPLLREFANDTMLDILYFMSPRHHDIMIDIVVNELNSVVEKYRTLTGFKGKISILSHSLGSVVMWDILSQEQCLPKPPNHNSAPQDLFAFPWRTSTDSTVQARHEPKYQYPHLHFEVANNFMIGSPVAVFLTLRDQDGPLSDTFSLPGCRRVFNIFHPYDPVAYRIEPLLDRRNAMAEPKIITHWKGGFRVQYQTKMLLQYLMDETRKTQKTVCRAVEAGIEGIGLMDATVNDLLEGEEIEDDSSAFSESSNAQPVYTGNLCEGKRIDYMLQEKEIENANEYLFALAAHSSYWDEKDLSLFIARQIFQTELAAPSS